MRQVQDAGRAMIRGWERLCEFGIPLVAALLSLGVLVSTARAATRLAWVGGDPVSVLLVGFLALLALIIPLLTLQVALRLFRMRLLEARVRRCVERADYRQAVRLARCAAEIACTDDQKAHYQRWASQLQALEELRIRACARQPG